MLQINPVTHRGNPTLPELASGRACDRQLAEKANFCLPCHVRRRQDHQQQGWIQLMMAAQQQDTQQVILLGEQPHVLSLQRAPGDFLSQRLLCNLPLGWIDAVVSSCCTMARAVMAICDLEKAARNKNKHQVLFCCTIISVTFQFCFKTSKFISNWWLHASY